MENFVGNRGSIPGRSKNFHCASLVHYYFLTFIKSAQENISLTYFPMNFREYYEKVNFVSRFISFDQHF